MNNMYTKVYWTHQFENGAKLGIMPRPRGNEWLEEEILKLSKQGAMIWVSLLESHEISELGLKEQPSLCSKYGIGYINFPIVDRGIPDKYSKVDQLVDKLYQSIQEGKSVITHCRMGIGRSSIIAACVLQKAGFRSDEILRKIIAARGLKVPDTEEQVKWLKARQQ